MRNSGGDGVDGGDLNTSSAIRSIKAGPEGRTSAVWNAFQDELETHVAGSIGKCPKRDCFLDFPIGSCDDEVFEAVSHNDYFPSLFADEKNLDASLRFRAFFAEGKGVVGIEQVRKVVFDRCEDHGFIR